MADVLKGYRTYLLTKASVTAVCSTRIYYGNLPQNPTYPAVVLHLITRDSQRHLTNAAALARSTVQADCHAQTHDTAENLSEQVRLVTEHYTGAWGVETIRHAQVDGIVDLSEDPVDGSQLVNHIRSMDVVAWHTEALPST